MQFRLQGFRAANANIAFLCEVVACRLMEVQYYLTALLPAVTLQMKAANPSKHYTYLTH
jgi:hypothetical protein